VSCLVCLASDTPLDILPNPHLKLLSVNEALAQGLEVPQSMLMDPELDPDEPETFLWSGITIEINPQTGEITPPPEDCWDIWPMDIPAPVRSEKQYFAEVEWPCCTPGRAEVLADYIRRHLECAEELELWNLWLGTDADLTRIYETRVPLSAFSPEHIIALCEKDIARPTFLGPVEEYPQYCLTITR